MESSVITVQYVMDTVPVPHLTIVRVFPTTMAVNTIVISVLELTDLLQMLVLHMVPVMDTIRCVRVKVDGLDNYATLYNVMEGQMLIQLFVHPMDCV